jgi:hypothetical protein
MRFWSHLLFLPPDERMLVLISDQISTDVDASRSFHLRVGNEVILSRILLLFCFVDNVLRAIN